MKIHEYQAKALLAEYGVPVPRSEPVFSVAEAKGAAERLGGRVVVRFTRAAGARAAESGWPTMH